MADRKDLRTSIITTMLRLFAMPLTAILIVSAPAPMTSITDGAFDDIGATISVAESSTSDSSPPHSDKPLPPGWIMCNGQMLAPVGGQAAICRDDFGVIMPAPITLSDIRYFVPVTPVIAGEPDGWAVKRKPANLTAPVSTHIVSGTLLDRPAEVRFTPIAWHWNYGDGNTATTTTGGATWAKLGQPRFTETATSHVYTTRGEVTAQVEVEYTAQYRYAGGDWVAIAGTLRIASADEPIRVVVGSTVLVDSPCSVAGGVSC